MVGNDAVTVYLHTVVPHPYPAPDYQLVVFLPELRRTGVDLRPDHYLDLAAEISQNYAGEGAVLPGGEIAHRGNPARDVYNLPFQFWSNMTAEHGLSTGTFTSRAERWLGAAHPHQFLLPGSLLLAGYFKCFQFQVGQRCGHRLSPQSEHGGLPGIAQSLFPLCQRQDPVDVVQECPPAAQAVHCPNLD